MTNVPDLDATLPSCVNVSGGVTDGNGAHHLSMVQCVDLTGVARNPWAHQSIRGERHRLHLSVGRHVKRVSAGDTTKDERRLNVKAKMKEVKIRREKYHSFFLRGFSRTYQVFQFQGNSGNQSSNIQAAANTLTVCRQGFL